LRNLRNQTINENDQDCISQNTEGKPTKDRIEQEELFLKMYDQDNDGEYDHLYEDPKE